MTLRLTAACAAMAALIAGCATGYNHPTAVATLRPTEGNRAEGAVTFTERSSGVRIVGQVRGLRPNSEHGFHVHEKGDCSAPDASSAGDHFNPTGVPHGFFGMPRQHAGDLPNIRADTNGVAQVDLIVQSLSVTGARNSVVGHGLVLHRDPDDYRSQPAGGSGPRIACAVITEA